jgi:CheY-like chemotaxis protein
MSDEKKRILYVEDERIFALEMHYVLESLGYEVCASVSTGEEAIEMLHEQYPDIVMMDIRLSGRLDGVETAMLIRRTNPEIPIIYISGFADRDTRAKLEQTAPYQLVNKPVDKELLVSALDAIGTGA